jgi:hypothetical protein
MNVKKYQRGGGGEIRAKEANFSVIDLVFLKKYQRGSDKFA